MHTLVPHQHQEDLSGIQYNEVHTKANSIIDYLELVFHIDLGNNHLEQIDNSNALDIDIQSTVAYIPTSLIYTGHVFGISVDQKILDLGVCSINNIPINNIYSSTLILRGPPFLS